MAEKLWTEEEVLAAFMEATGWPRAKVIAFIEASVRASQARLCEQCGKPYRPHRSDSKVCSNACRQRAYRERLIVTQMYCGRS